MRMSLQRSYLSVLGLFVAIPGYYGLAALLYAVVSPDPHSPWGGTHLHFLTACGLHHTATYSKERGWRV
jgi:hypothetical protein